ncbi:MAG: hypothetical protein DI571_07615 [Arsenicicoccus sp.]|nr:MAG: hypothetical protein DI571_07615 [Arsenicicoccus sp.]
MSATVVSMRMTSSPPARRRRRRSWVRKASGSTRTPLFLIVTGPVPGWCSRSHARTAVACSGRTSRTAYHRAQGRSTGAAALT